MQSGIFFVAESPDGDYRRTYREVLELSVYAEELGFDTVWLAEHHGTEYGVVPSPPILATAIAERTERIRLGVMVSILPFQHPIRIAEDYAMLDVLSGGRLNFGTGRGYQPREFEVLGLDAAESRSRFTEGLEAILGLWEHGTFTYRGEHYSFEDFELHPRPLQERVPVWVAALSPETYELAARNRVQILTQPNPRQSFDDLKENVAVAARTFIQHGFAPEEIDFPLNMIVHLAPTMEEARRDSEDALAWYWGKLRGLVPGSKSGGVARGYESYGKAYAAGDDRFTFERLNADRLQLVGTPEMAREFVTEVREEIGVKHFSCFMRIGGLETAKVRRSMELWASEVMPAFADDPPVPSAFLAGAA